MPLIRSDYQSPAWLRPGHVSTIFSSLLPGPAAPWTDHERLELPDGDFLDLAWLRPPAPGNVLTDSGSGPEAKPGAPLAILSHGLEGSLQASYIRGMATTLAAAGWHVLAWNYRSCGGIPNRLARSYHSGETADLRLLAERAAERYPKLDLLGFSLGGTITLKLAAEPGLPAAIRSACAISAPVDLASSARALDVRRGNRLYLHRFLTTLLAKARAKSRQFPGCLDPAALTKIRTIRDFDEHVTAPLHGFAGAEDYWTRASSLPGLPSLAVPSLLLNAANDPLLDAPSFPTEIAERSSRFFLEVPAHGGHVGFPSGIAPARPWHEKRVLRFLESLPSF
ncbi:MAG: hypothetical protein JWL81_1126 [Verrucomicrobiales bacterium]|nr:hypothetical protein [Verrucomicrobiales bacterium]